MHTNQFAVVDVLCSIAVAALVHRKGGMNRLVRICHDPENGMYGFSLPGEFHSVVALIQHFTEHSLEEYNNKLSVKLLCPVERSEVRK